MKGDLSPFKRASARQIRICIRQNSYVLFQNQPSVLSRASTLTDFIGLGLIALGVVMQVLRKRAKAAA